MNELIIQNKSQQKYSIYYQSMELINEFPDQMWIGLN